MSSSVAITIFLFAVSAVLALTEWSSCASSMEATSVFLTIFATSCRHLKFSSTIKKQQNARAIEKLGADSDYFSLEKAYSVVMFVPRPRSVCFGAEHTAIVGGDGELQVGQRSIIHGFHSHRFARH